MIEIPEIKNKKKLVLQAHINSGHMGCNVVYQNLKNDFYWTGITKTIENIYKKCKLCLQYNNGNKGRQEHVITNFPNEMVAIDMMNPKKDTYIILMIDYFSRYAFGKIVKTKESKDYIYVIDEYIKKWAQ